MTTSNYYSQSSKSLVFSTLPEVLQKGHDFVKKGQWLLGHRNLKTTQHNAKILDKKVSDDMHILKEKLTRIL